MLIQLLTSLLPSLTVSNTKVHLAQHNGIEHPMDVYLAGILTSGNRGSPAGILNVSTS